MKKSILFFLLLVFSTPHIKASNISHLILEKDSLLNVSPFFKAKTIFNPLTDGMGYHNYRIPSLLHTKKGTLLAIMEGREGMNFDHAKNDIVLKRSTDNGKTWSAPKVIAASGDNVVMNPTIVQALDGTIILTYIYFPEKRHSGNRSHGVTQVDPGLKGDTIEKLFIIKSTDDGLTFSQPIEITNIAKKNKKSLYAISGPGVGITLTKGKNKGRIIIPMSETFKTKESIKDTNFALYSDDSGQTWKHGKAMPASKEGDSGGNEIQMVELEGGTVLASVRSKGFRLLTRSTDGGDSWEPLQKHLELADTGCMSPILRYRWKSENEPGILIHIGVTGRLEKRRRGNAVISLSYDDGKSWPVKKTLYSKTFDYSSLVKLKNGDIAMLAEYDFDGNRAKTKFATFNIAWILSKNNSISLTKEVQRPKHYFKTHPDHKIPTDMVIQKFNVELEAEFHTSSNDLLFKYEFLQKKGAATFLNEDNFNQFSTSKKNTFRADWYGKNIIKVTAKNLQGEIVGSVIDTIFVQFSHTQMAGGDIKNLDSTYVGKEYITGKIVNDTLIYQGMRFKPSNIQNGDQRYEGTKFGAYETKEPRVLALKSGNLIASYHYQVKGKNDAPPGLTIVLARSLDGGKTWIDDQILMQDINGVVGYTSMIEWNGEIHCYIAGGHQSHQYADTYKGVYRTISKDEGKTWSQPVLMDEMTELISLDRTKIAPNQSPNTNALFVPNMTWKGKTSDAYIVPFYVSPIKFLITLDGGNSWDIFYDEANYPELKREINEMSWVLLENRTIYLVSRRQSKKGYKNEFIFDLDGTPTFIGQKNKNHKARRCHQGAVKIADGAYKDRIAVASNFSGDREEATIALSKTAAAKEFTTKFLTSNAAWGYCHIDWNRREEGFILIGESEPFDENENVIPMDNGPDRNERFSLECFAFSPTFYETLVEANIHQ